MPVHDGCCFLPQTPTPNFSGRLRQYDLTPWKKIPVFSKTVLNALGFQSKYLNDQKKERKNEMWTECSSKKVMILKSRKKNWRIFSVKMKMKFLIANFAQWTSRWRWFWTVKGSLWKIFLEPSNSREFKSGRFLEAAGCRLLSIMSKWLLYL